MRAGQATPPASGRMKGHNWRSRALAITPAIAAMSYPLLLSGFHALVGPPGTGVSPQAAVMAAATAASMLLISALGIVFAARRHASSSARRLAYACVAAPTLYVMLGVAQALAGSTIPDPALWTLIWASAALWTWCRADALGNDRPAPAPAKWRVLHGVSGGLLLTFISFHLFNHLLGLAGPDAHAGMMKLGRALYRTPVIETALVVLMLLQVASGLHLAWRWSEAAQDLQRTFQVATGVYLSVFILGHMNSVFIYARTFLGIPTVWAFATGGDAGLVHDPWNIRLVPHYFLGVFFVLAHLAAGLRVVMKSHRVRESTIRAVWTGCILLSAVVATLIMAALSGMHLPPRE